jgi:zinc protease
MFRRSLMLWTVALTALAPLGAAEIETVRPKDGDVLPLTAYTATLENGLKVIVVPTPFPNIVSVQIPVQTGSRNEVEEGKSGFAHFFEHMMFRGTPNVSAAEYDAIMTRAGARRNAYTTDDFTNYFATFAKDDLETILRVEADRFQNLQYSVEDFKTESRAVLGEYNKNSANPISKLIEVQRDHAFDTHPYQHTTMGFIEDIEDMPNEFDYSLAFFDRWYRPRNTAIVVAGDVEPQSVVDLVRKYWGEWKAGEPAAVEIPAEPTTHEGPVYAHVAWQSETIPWVSVGFHGPELSTRATDWAAVSMLSDLYFGSTSDLYKRLVEQEQVVDQLFNYFPGNADPYLFTIFARVKDPARAVYVRDQILETFARARGEAVDATRLENAKSNARYGFARSLDNTGEIAATLARFVRYDRSYATLNEIYRVYASLTAEDLQQAANRYFVDDGMVVTTLSHQPLPEGIDAPPAMSSLMPSGEAADDVTFVTQASELPVLDVKLLFEIGSAYDPPGKEGLSALAAAMITDAGSEAMAIDEIKKKLYPLAASFNAQVDKEMTTFTAIFHRDTWKDAFAIGLPMLLEPGFREEDFQRVKDNQRNALKQDLRSDNEEELGKELLQQQIFEGTRYAHPVLGTLAGIDAIALEDVRQFVRDAYTRGNLTVGISGDLPEGLEGALRSALGKLPKDPGVSAPESVIGTMPDDRKVTIVQKETRATAISFGHPIPVTRKHPDFPALWLARAWLGEHRSSMSHLYQRIREVRGMNYGDYAYIEAFPRGMYQFFPDPNLGRRAQIFEIWIRPVTPENAHMALRIAAHELQRLISEGLTQEQLDATREYLTKNVYVMTSTQDQQLGYALDQQWYDLPEYTQWMRGELAKLTLEDVNRAIQKHLTADRLEIVMITRDAEGLKEALISDAFSPIAYDAEKPQELLDEDQVLGALRLEIEAEDVEIVPVEEVFAGR